MQDGAAIETRASLSGGVRQRQTAHEFVRETLRRAILSGEIAGGTRLVQAELAEMLQVSTTPVREALRDLAAEGLIRLDAHRGGVVHEATNEELIEIYDIRKILEPAAMRLAVPKITDDVIDRVQALHEEVVVDPDAFEFVDYNREFHLSIYDAAGSPRLAAILKSLMDASVVYVSANLQRRPEVRGQAMRDHGHILEALRARDVECAAEAILEHIRIPHAFFLAKEA